ncbi:transcription factor [Fusarium longipes]|uniref:Transcription factor n=1 Tax=Fusarium longipes TaxID=694270 RepID=A0A395T011_9HYPO|nr:transcription factor [Fusarium longipes]
MAPTDDEIEQALLDATYQVYQANPDETTVNKVRKQTEQDLGLDDGFLASDDWKKKSKELIKQRVEKLMDGWTPEEKNEAGSDGEEEKSTGVKRSSPNAESPQPKPKRQKRASKEKTAPKSKSKKAAMKEESDVESVSGESSELSELSDLSEEEKPQKKRKAAPPKKAAPKRRSKKAVVSEDEDEDGDVAMDSDTGSLIEKDEKPKNGDSVGKKATSSAEAQNLDGGEDEIKPTVDEEEEYSDVIDEPPKPKRKKKEKKEKKEGTSKPAKAPKAAAKKSSTSDDPNTEEIKKLQGYLVKCGVRKLWHNELKQYGDDAKAKIRHLKKMLSDVGMDGRFSESKAREIKERRELLAEVESAQEMSSLWGVEGRSRASRSKSKKIIESDASDAENNDGNNYNVDDDDEEEDNSYAARRKRARADLAFLGDDDESD